MVASNRFYFVRFQIVVFDTDRRVTTVDEMAEAIGHMSAGSIFYHFIDARRRTPLAKDDFSMWLMDIAVECQGLLERISLTDPYFTTLTELREDLQWAFAQHIRERRR